MPMRPVSFSKGLNDTTRAIENQKSESLLIGASGNDALISIENCEIVFGEVFCWRFVRKEIIEGSREEWIKVFGGIA